MVQLLREGSQVAQLKAAGALLHLAKNDLCKDAIREEGGIQPLMQLLERLEEAAEERLEGECTWEDFLAELERLEQVEAGTTSTPIQKPRKRHDLSPSPAKERSYMCLGSKGEREKGKGKFKAKGLQSLPSPYNRA